MIHVRAPSLRIIVLGGGLLCRMYVVRTVPFFITKTRILWVLIDEVKPQFLRALYYFSAIALHVLQR